jgi:phage shock protein PspC (stress-responsive transcriptional regulator)
MVSRLLRPDDRPMTTEQPTAPRMLRRRSSDRVVGGVASGLGDYFNVDPLLIRIGFVGLMVFGGMGIFLYVAAWLLMPDETTERSIAQRVLDRVGLGGGFFASVLIVLGAIVLINVLGNVADRSGGVPAVAFALVVIVAGVMVLRRGETDTAVVAAAPSAADAATPAVAPARTVVRRPPRPPSPLGWYALGAVLVGIGALAAATNVTGAAIDPGRYFGLALGVIGIGLVIGAWWGHAHWLILLGLLLVPFAFAASLIMVPIEGGWGSHRFSPTTTDALRDEYRLVGGEIRLDLTEVETGDEPIVITASVAMGEILVWLPEDANLELDAAVGGGRLRILDDFQSGTRLQDRYLIDGDGQRFVLDLEAGLGDVRVETVQAEGR